MFQSHTNSQKNLVDRSLFTEQLYHYYIFLNSLMSVSYKRVIVLQTAVLCTQFFLLCFLQLWRIKLTFPWKCKNHSTEREYFLADHGLFFLWFFFTHDPLWITENKNTWITFPIHNPVWNLYFIIDVSAWRNRRYFVESKILKLQSLKVPVQIIFVSL